VYCLELLTRCWLTLDRRDEAERAAALAAAAAEATRLPLAAAWADRAAAAVALHSGDTACAGERALASADTAFEIGAPIESALSRTLAGKALARAGQSDRAVSELRRAAAALDACGALRYRESAERELGKLGHRPHRRTRRGTSDGTSIDSLTGRELQVARLVVDRKTNSQIAAELFLSQKTVETHLRNIFRKLAVSTRVEAAQLVEQADEAARSVLLSAAPYGSRPDEIRVHGQGGAPMSPKPSGGTLGDAIGRRAPDRRPEAGRNAKGGATPCSR